MVLGVWQYYYTIRDEFCQPLLYTTFKKKEVDHVLQFLEERCERNEDASTRAKSLFDAYKIWCKSNGYYVCTSKKFNAGLEQHPEWHNGKKVSHGYTVFDGVSLKTCS